MKGTICLLTVLVVVIGWVSADTLVMPKDVSNSFYSGRSGDIVIYNKNTNNVAGHAVFVNQKELSTEINETEVGDLISHLMGLPPLNPHRSRSHYPKTDFFTKPKANLLFVIDSSNVEHFSTLRKESKHTILRESYPSHSTSTLVSMLTGHLPSSHGIIGNSWFDRLSNSKTLAQDSWASSTSVIANIADLFTLTSKGSSLVLSASASKALARSLSSSQLSLPSESNSYGFYLNKNKFESVYDVKSNAKSVAIGKAEIQEIRFEIEGSVCSWSLENEGDVKVLSELALIHKTLDYLKNNLSNLVTDSFSDLLSFGIESLKNNYQKGSHSEKCALHLIDTTIQEIITKVNEMYGNSVLIEVLFLNSFDEQISPEIEQRLRAVLPSGYVSKNTVGQFYPNVYFTETVRADKKNSICKRVSDEISDLGLEAVCMPEPAHFALDAESMKVLRNHVRAATNTTDSEMETFQISLWTTVGLVVAIVVGSYTMFTIDPSTDTLLYSQDINHPNPKFQ